MNIKYLNESFKRLYEADITPEPLTESFATELRDQLNDHAMILSMRGATNIKDYEIAFQEVIENMEPDKSWFDVTGLNIYWDLLENRDIQGCIDRIIDNLKPEYKDRENEIPVDEAFFPEDIDDEEPVEEDLLIRGKDGKLTTTSDPGRWGNSKEWNWNNESLKEALESILSRLNEAEISPEDQADSDLIRSMINKMQARSNARFTPEEQSVLTKYGITRDNNNKELLVGDRTLNPKRDVQSGYYYDKNWNRKSYSTGTSSKINYADRARKLGPRQASQASGDGSRWFYQNRDINSHNRRSLNRDSLINTERNHQAAVMSEPVRHMKQALSSRKYAQDTLDIADAKRDQALRAAERTYNAQVDSANRQHAYEIDSASKSKAYNQKEIDRLLKKDLVD